MPPQGKNFLPTLFEVYQCAVISSPVSENILTIKLYRYLNVFCYRRDLRNIIIYSSLIRTCSRQRILIIVFPIGKSELEYIKLDIVMEPETLNKLFNCQNESDWRKLYYVNIEDTKRGQNDETLWI